MKLLVTGSCGFIGSHLLGLLLRREDIERVTSLDALTYAANLKNIAEFIENPRHRLVRGSIADGKLVEGLFAEEKFDAVLNLAAESHVDRSIESATPFIQTNIMGTHLLLDAAQRHGVRRFVQISTDEVYGSLELDSSERFREETAITPRSPYAASKAAADLLALAAAHTHRQDVVITRCSNNYGPNQFPEKLIPLMTINALRDKPLPVYGDGKNVRDWIHVEDHCEGIIAALLRGRAGEVYNFGADSEWANIDLVKQILRILDKPESLIQYVKDRPGHDRRYAMEASKAQRELGWKPRIPFEEGLRGTIAWYRDHADWWHDILSGKYQTYYDAWRRNMEN